MSLFNSRLQWSLTEAQAEESIDWGGNEVFRAIVGALRCRKSVHLAALSLITLISRQPDISSDQS